MHIANVARLGEGNSISCCTGSRDNYSGSIGWQNNKIIIRTIIIIIIPMSLKYRDDIPRGIVKSYGQMKCCLAFVGNHLEMVSR